MAVSKTQNERPAIVALIDLANQLEVDSDTHARNIETLTEGLADEAEARAQAVQDVQTQIGDGFAETSVTTSLGATNQQVTLLGGAQAALAEDVGGILAQLENIRFGIAPEVTVPASDSYAGSCVYTEPFDATSKSFVMLGFADGPSPATLSLDLTISGYAGFSYSITNTDTDPATVTVGYLAIAAIPLS